MFAEGASGPAGSFTTFGAPGWAGAPAGTSGAEAADGSLDRLFTDTATTVKLYAVPLARPVQVRLVPATSCTETPPGAGLIVTS